MYAYIYIYIYMSHFLAGTHKMYYIVSWSWNASILCGSSNGLVYGSVMCKAYCYYNTQSIKWMALISLDYNQQGCTLYIPLSHAAVVTVMYA